MKKKYSDQFKLKVAIEALKGLKTIPEMCQEFGILSCQIYDWKKKLEISGAQVFSPSQKTINNNGEKDLEKLHAIIGKLKVENDFLAKALGR